MTIDDQTRRFNDRNGLIAVFMYLIIPRQTILLLLLLFSEFLETHCIITFNGN